ncbi:S-layer homology domain-containing protein [Paenibacillus agaridevorans]|uniref:S-layer homology domain-containing protein n=1 Tax=Paenibacillus agaridevorans TaxID=171404 RepID=UPI001BE4C48B|nr:S-layer homology domain-containing protein [Paenibacillus agaridevorans]
MKRKKTMILAGLAAVLASSALAFGPVQVDAAKTSADFTDLKDLDAATKAKFDALISAGIFEGVGDGTFGLKDEMNRAQFAKVAALIYGLDVNKDAKTSSFSDVKSDDPANGYALPYIEAIKKAGITDGMGDGRFNPAGDVTKEQLATFLVRGLGKDDEAKEEQGVKDDTVSDWAKGYVALALELKLLSNGSDGKFGGNSNATRDLLVLGAYEAKEQFIPPGSVKPSASPTPTTTPTATPTPTPTSTPYYPPVSTPTPTVPAIQGLELTKGSVAFSSKITSSDLAEGNTLHIAIAEQAIAVPYTGTNINRISDAAAYEIGTDIKQLSSGRHIRLYEVNPNNIIVKFADITLNSNQIAEAPASLQSSEYSNLTPGEGDGYAKFEALSLPEGAFSWKVKSGTIDMDIPAAGALFEGNPYTPGGNIDISGGKTTVILVAVNSTGHAVGYSMSTYSTTPGPVEENQDSFRLSPLYAGQSSSLTVVFDEPLSSSTTLLNISDLIASITVTSVSGSPVEIDPTGEGVSILWSPSGSSGGEPPFNQFEDEQFPPGGGGMPIMQTSLEIIFPIRSFSAGDVVRVTFKEGALIDASNSNITQIDCETTVIAPV